MTHAKPTIRAFVPHGASLERTIAAWAGVVAACSAAVALLWFLSGPSTPAIAAPTDEWHVCPAGPPTCHYTQIQAAVDEANPGDVIKVAQGIYTDLHHRDTITQVVYIGKSVTIRGGYVVSDWATPDPAAHPTTLDAGGKGRVIYITGDITPTLEGLWLTDGSANDLGGGIYALNARPSVSGCWIFENKAEEHGGGVYLQSSDDAVLMGNRVYSNTADIRGGGIFLGTSDGVTLAGNWISDNKASNSGGGVRLERSADVILRDNHIFDNVASVGGGAFVDWSDGVSLTGNHFYHNTATSSHGGGLYLFNSDDATLTANQVFSNTTESAGGGIYVNRSASLRVINSIIAQNRAELWGDGLHVNGLVSAPSDGLMINNTLAQNSLDGDGRGVYLDRYASLTLTNNIIVSHTIGIYARPAYSNAVTADHTLFYGNDEDTEGSVIVTNNEILDDAPLFVEPARWNYHVQPDSPAVDAGVTVPWLTTDVDGERRPQGEGYDVGADEVSRRIYLPLLLRNN